MLWQILRGQVGMISAFICMLRWVLHHYSLCLVHCFGSFLLKDTVLPESIDPLATFLPWGLDASLTRYSRIQPCLYLGKTEDGIRPGAAAFWTRYYPSNKDASSLSNILFPSRFFATKHAWMLSLESLHFHRKVAFDKADHRCRLQDW